jgi:Protein of unknown function (DUF4240)
MTDDQFWAIVDHVHDASEGDMDLKEQLIKAAISRMSHQEAQDFYQPFERAMDAAFSCLRHQWRVRR